MHRAAVYMGLLFTLLARPLPAQSPPATAVLEGDIVNADTGTPIPHARIKIEKLTTDVYAKTDAQGHFEFAPVATGQYTWSVESPGFLPVERGSVNLGGPERPVVNRRGVDEVAQVTRTDRPDGTAHFKIKVPLTAYAVINGRVTDPTGLPIEDCRISVIAQDGSATRIPRTFTEVGSLTSTNEKGEFRAAGLPPGTYYVTATRELSGDTSFRTTYSPGSLDKASAKPIVVVAGQSARADIRLIQISGVQVTGHVIAPPGSPAVTGRVTTRIELVPAPGATNRERYSTSAAPAKDSYLLENVLPGKYTLMAVTSVQDEDQRPRDARQVAGSKREVEVSSQNIRDLDVAQQPLHDIQGTVTFAAGCSPRPVQLMIRQTGDAVGTRAAGAIPVGADGRFIVPSLGVGAFTVRTAGAIRLSSAHLGDLDVLRDGLTSPVAGNDPLLITVDCATGAAARLP